MSTTGVDWISQQDLLRSDYAMLAITSTVFTTRVGAQIWRRRAIQVQDMLLFIAFLAYLAFTILFIMVTPNLFRLQALENGELAPWPGMEKDLKFASEVMWQCSIEYWTCLWFVKFSLLALYKKLLAGMPRAYLWVWWGTLVFCIVTWATCIITGPGISCDDLKKFFDEGVLCSSLSEKRRQTASLYFGYAVDTVTNLMVMFLPIKLIWNLQMQKAKKIGCGLLFASGFVCILFSTVRAVQVGQDGRPQNPDARWVTMWTIVECSAAVIIGCCPGLASMVPKGWARSSNSMGYDAQGYVRQSQDQSDESATGSHCLQDLCNPKGGRKSEKPLGQMGISRTGNESEDELPERRTGDTGIRITDELREQHKRKMEGEGRLEADRLGM